MDILNTKALASARSNLASIQAQHTAALAKIKELEARIDGIQFTKNESSSITFYIDKNLNIRVESKANRDMANKLVEENYIGENQVEDPEAHHLAYVLIANEVTDQMVQQYQGVQVDAKEINEPIKDSDA